jgi:hypothetical protein
MNKGEWRKRARKWGGEAEQLRAEVQDLRHLVQFHRKEKYALLAWQRSAREARPRDVRVHTERSLTDSRDETRWVSVFRDDWDKLRRAIEGDKKEET